MSTNASDFYANWPRRMNAMKAAAPDLGKAFGPFFQGLMKDGAITAKEKELIAVGIAVAIRCESCIYAHVEKALKHGNSPAAIMEAAGVAVMMGGGPAYTYAPIVSEALAHLSSSEPST